jgi:hypothetical protein
MNDDDYHQRVNDVERALVWALRIRAALYTANVIVLFHFVTRYW